MTENNGKTLLIAESSAVLRSIQKDVFSAIPQIKKIIFAINSEDFFYKLDEEIFNFAVLDFSLFKTQSFNSVLKSLNSKNIKTIIYGKKSDFIFPEKNYFLMEKPSFTFLNEDELKKLSLFFKKKFSDFSFPLNTFSSSPKSFTNSAANSEVENKQDSSVNLNFPKEIKAVLIGVSTGGPGTIQKLLEKLDSKNFPVPILITQHIEKKFDASLCSWLSANTSFKVCLAKNNMIAKKGFVYFAPADFHLELSLTDKDEISLILSKSEPENFVRPSVDRMFLSAAQILKNKCIAILLTGMGVDGAKGLLKIKKSGGYTITQDESSCVVYGMPKAAVENGSSTESLSLEKIPERLKVLLKIGKTEA